jgi:hypothetical protein
VTPPLTTGTPPTVHPQANAPARWANVRETASVQTDCLRRFKWPMLGSRIGTKQKCDANRETVGLRARAIASPSWRGMAQQPILRLRTAMQRALAARDVTRPTLGGPAATPSAVANRDHGTQGATRRSPRSIGDAGFPWRTACRAHHAGRRCVAGSRASRAIEAFSATFLLSAP